MELTVDRHGRTTFHRLYRGVALTLVALGAASACTSDQGASGAATASRDSAGVTIIEHPGVRSDDLPALRLEAEPAFVIGGQDGGEGAQFTAVVGAGRLDDGSFVILDRREFEVRVFGSDGRFLRRFGGRGGGPGEFEDPKQLALGPDERIIVWDGRKRQVFWFTSRGELVRSADLPASDVPALAVLPGDGLLAVTEESATSSRPPVSGRMQNTGRIIRLAASGEAEERATFPATEWLMLVAPTGVQIQRPWFLPSLLSAAAPDGVWITNGTSWELARHDLEGELDRIVRIATPLEPFSLDRIRALQERELAADLTDQARQSLTRTQEGRQYPETIRPIGALLADAAGRIWVGHQEVPPVRLPSGMGSTAREWTILADAGERLLGTVTLPEGRRPIHADRDGVLLLGVDEVDVPLLEWWRFVP